MTRIASLAANNQLVQLLLRTQSRLQDNEVQVASEKISQDYKGIALDSERLVNLENTRNALSRYVDNNTIAGVRLDIAGTTIEALRQTIDDFQGQLASFHQFDAKGEVEVKDIQDAAFRALKAMEGFLNTEADGRFLFSGARVTTQPVDLGLTDLAAFQARYDGTMVAYPTTRDAHLAEFSISANLTGDTTWLGFERDNGGVGRITANDDSLDNLKVGTTITISGTASNNGTYQIASVNAAGNYITVVTEMLTTRANDTGGGNITLTTAADATLGVADFTDLSFDQATGVITAGGGTPFSALKAGEIFTITNATDSGNNQIFTIESVTATTITIKQKKLTDEGAGQTAAGTIAAASYYKGDETIVTHRMDTNQTFDFDTTAVDPAFEKAIRAMAIIAQGVFATEGGLEQNKTRVTDALYLLNNALSPTTSGTPPYGTEKAGNLRQLQVDLGFDLLLVRDTNERHTKFIAFLESRISDTENVDLLEAITRLLDESRALEASFQALAHIRELSLSNFLR
ncbi:MAG: hypothetical protein IH925_07605 [Proteobacteria bacterium]|nr:hypothetical protein [Pseudomonadota bacterium]